MDKTKIEELRDRKQQVQEQVRLKKLRERIASQLAHLETLVQPYTIHYKFENLNWIASNVKVRDRDGYYGIHGDFQIDVDDSTVKSNLKIRQEEINSDKFSKQFLLVVPETASLIVCYQGGDPELEISVKSFLSHPTKFLSRPETWIITADKKLIIEYIWEQEVIRFIQLKDSVTTLVKKIIIQTTTSV